MSKVIVGMTISLDGFVGDEAGNIDRLYPDLGPLHGTGYMNDAIAETGAVLMGRRTFEMADPDWYVGNFEFQVPIFVLTHHPPKTPPNQDEHLTFTFLEDGIERAVALATAAAGERAATVVGGATVVGEILGAGLADEIRLDLMPVFLGSGLRLFNGKQLSGLHLRKLKVEEVGERTSIRYQVGAS